MRTLALILIVGLSSAAHAGWKATVANNDEVEITAESLFDRVPSAGYLPITVTIDNSTNSDLTYDITAKASRGYSNDQTTGSTSQRVRVPASRQTVARLLAPIPVTASKSDYRSATVSVLGPHLQGNGRASMGGAQVPSTKTTNFTAMSSALALRTWGPLEELAKKEKPLLIGSAFNPADLSADWRALSGVDTLWITDAEFDALRPDQRTAVITWVHQGGQLFWVLPENSTRTLAEFAPTYPGAKMTNLALGTISLRRWDGSELPTGETLATLKTDRPDVEEHLSSDYITGWKLSDALGQLRFPVPLLITFIALFAITIGPLNLFWFARSGRRQRLFWTTPLISLVASLLLGLIIWFQDGSGGTGRRLTFSLLLPDSNQMLIRQEQISRTGVLFDRAFTLDEPTLVLPIPLTANSASEPTRDFRQADETLSGDWFSSRTVQAQYLETIVPTRARIELVETAPDGTPTLLSSVPHQLDEILYTDAQGRRWHAAPLRTGEKATLTPATGAQTNAIFKADDSGPMIRDPWTRQQKGRSVFHAISTTGPTLATLPAIRWQNDRTLLTGPVK